MKAQNWKLIQNTLDYLDKIKIELEFKTNQFNSLKEEKLTLESQASDLKQKIFDLEGKLTLEEEKNYSLTNQINEIKSISPTVLAQGGIVELKDEDLQNLHKTLEVQLAYRKKCIIELHEQLRDARSYGKELKDENLRLTKLVKMYENQEN